MDRSHLAQAAGIAARATAIAVVGLVALPGVALGHELSERYEAPLPLVAYLAGAALAVAMSFVFVMMRNAAAPTQPPRGRARAIPSWLRRAIRATGLLAWLWIVAQTISGGSGEGEVAGLFVWVYGWVGLALVSALLGPLWAWLDPFSTIHDLLALIGRRLGLSIGESASYPAWLGRWPAVIAFVVVMWIELVGRIEGGRSLGLFVIAYTAYTVAAMAYFGRDKWRAEGEAFGVWFGLLGRLAPLALEGPVGSGTVVRRPFASGLMAATWSRADLVLIALATGSIIFDGLSQTQLYFDLFVATSMFGTTVVRDTVTAFLVLGGLATVVLLVARRLGNAALGAGLLPVAVGYLIAHYMTYLLIDGQRLLAALNDPLLRGDNLLPFDLGFWEPSLFLPTAAVWAIQLGAVVGGHIVGAWAGHAALAGRDGRASVALQLPLALLMVVLTTITLWSLGQAVLVEPAAALVR